MNELQLNDAKNYKEFYGRIIEQMPKLVAEGRTPLSVSGLMRRRLEVLNSPGNVRSSYWDNYFDTGDAIAYHPDGKAKIVLDTRQLRELTPSSQLKDNALVLPAGVYDELEGVEFSREDLEKYASGEWLKQKDVTSNKIWQALARDGKLLDDYAKAVFSQVRERYDSNISMALFVDSARDVPIIRSWYVGRLDDDFRSNASGRCHLDGGYGRLVGVQVAPEAQSASPDVAGPTLDQVVSVTAPYVADMNRESLRRDLRGLYK